MAVKVVIHGLERVKGKFGALKNKFPEFLNESTLNAVLYVHSKMPKYPPAPASSTYRRTGTLGRTITAMKGNEPEALSRVESAFGNVKGIVGTKLSYAPWVIDKERQTKGHKANGWWNLQDVVYSLRSGIKETYKKALGNFLRRNF